jgi:hypothetical protein
MRVIVDIFKLPATGVARDTSVPFDFLLYYFVLYLSN